MVHLKDTRLLRALHAHFSRRRIVRRVTHERLLGSSQDEHPAAVHCIGTRSKAVQWGGRTRCRACAPHAAACGPPARRPGGWADTSHWPAAGSRQPRLEWAAHGPAWAEQRRPGACGRHGMALPMQRHAGPLRGVRAAGPTSPVGPRRARASRAPQGPRMGPHGPWCRPSCVFEMACAPMQRHAGPLRGARAAGPRPSVGPLRARASRAPHGPRMGPHGPPHEQRHRIDRIHRKGIHGRF
jgi:hypothetical protein